MKEVRIGRDARFGGTGDTYWLIMPLFILNSLRNSILVKDYYYPCDIFLNYDYELR
jgi:hypothetical protein